MVSQIPVGQTTFRFLFLPPELQLSILSYSLDAGVSAYSLLCLTRQLHSEVLSLLYSDIHLPSVKHLRSFLDDASENRQRLATQHARTFTIDIPGVPGGSTKGGRESAPGSPTRNASQGRNIDDRLLLVSRAIQLCPNIHRCSIQMFGVRHSSLLTSNDYIAEETNAFRVALSKMKKLKSFSWLTPKENINFKGLSIAVVDLAFDPLIEGLEVAALDMDLDGRRIIKQKGDVKRYHHPLEEIILHHCIFPSNRGKKFFQLFTKMHPDDENFVMFPRLRLICIKKATNVDPVNVALLVLFWQFLLDDNKSKSCYNDDWNPVIMLEDVYVNSIWGPRLTDAVVCDTMKRLVEDALKADDEKQVSSNAYIRALEESVELDAKLDKQSSRRLRCMEGWQRERLIKRACQRVRIEFVEGSIAGYQ